MSFQGKGKREVHCVRERLGACLAAPRQPATRRNVCAGHSQTEVHACAERTGLGARLACGVLTPAPNECARAGPETWTHNVLFHGGTRERSRFPKGIRTWRWGCPVQDGEPCPKRSSNESLEDVAVPRARCPMPKHTHASATRTPWGGGGLVVMPAQAAQAGPPDAEAPLARW